MFRRTLAAVTLVLLCALHPGALMPGGMAAAAPPAPDYVAAFPPVTAVDPVVQGMIAEVETATVRQYTGDLSGEWEVTIRGEPYTIGTRSSRSRTPIRQATKYVGDHLASLDLDVEYHEWHPDWPPNVIGQKTGEARPGEIYMITAHLDDMPEMGAAPGADDNASGSVAVLVAADILSQYRWDCTLRFALWTGEEQGLEGSQGYAYRSYSLQENIAGVLNLDMIAWNEANSAPGMELHARAALPATVNLANQFASVIDVYDINLIPEVIPAGIPYSDHASFWNRGYTALLGIEDHSHDFNPYYHTTEDRLARLDMAYFTEFVRASVAALAHMTGCVVKSPAAPALAATVEAEGQEPGRLTLAWQHVVPNTEYRLYYAEQPYFKPSEATWLATFQMPFATPLRYLHDSSGAGNVQVNHYYVVQGLNEAGASADSKQVGEFDFTLVRGE